jgi:hypothetical protein
VVNPTLADVATSAAAAVGAPGFIDRLGLGPCRHVVVLLVDGLGWNALARHRDLAPALAGMSGEAIDAVFPTTTPVGLGSFGTGLLPGAHGLVGASFWLPESDEVLSPLHWGDRPLPVAVQPEPTVFEAVARAGIAMATVSPAGYRESGLTRATLRGGDYRPADDAAERMAQVAAILTTSGPSFTYVYWFELDRIGHEFGVASRQWRDALVRVDDLVAGLLSALPSGSTLVVTADHGMVDCPPEARIQIEDHPSLMVGVKAVTGDPRARHVYVRPGAAHDVRDTWRAILGDRVDVYSRAQVVSSRLMGDVDPALAGRIGDIMAVSGGAALLASRTDATVSGLLGQHGALTDDEVLIPALIHRCD